MQFPKQMYLFDLSFKLILYSLNKISDKEEMIIILMIAQWGFQIGI